MKTTASNEKVHKHGGIYLSYHRPVQDFDPRNLSQAIAKGEQDIKRLNLNEIDDLLRYLRTRAHDKIKHLKGKTNRSFRELISYVSLLHDSSTYSMLFENIDRHFEDLVSAEIGTIGAYCIGFRMKTNLPQPVHVCTPGYIGSIPRPKRSGHPTPFDPTSSDPTSSDPTSSDPTSSVYFSSDNFTSDLDQGDQGARCNLLCVWAEYDNYRYNFNLLNDDPRNDEIGYIFTNCTQYKYFPGFSSSEKEYLSSMGVQKYILYGYEKDGSYRRLLKHPTYLKHIKNRIPLLTVDEDNNYHVHKSIPYPLILMMIGLFIVIIAIVYYYYQRNKKV